MNWSCLSFRISYVVFQIRVLKVAGSSFLLSFHRAAVGAIAYQRPLALHGRDSTSVDDKSISISSSELT